MARDKDIITKCLFCGKNIKDNFGVNGLIIICPYCNKPQV